MYNIIYKFLKLKYVYYNSFKTLNEIPNNFKTENQYMSKEQTFSEYEQYKKNNFFFKIRESFLPIFISSLENELINILDVGGRFNQLYDFINLATNKKINVTVFETSTVFELMKGLNFKNNNRYIDSLDDLKKYNTNLDIAYFGSSFQYFIPFEPFVNKIFHLKPKFIVITDTIFLEKKDSLVTLQINSYPSIIPHQFNNLNYVINFFLKNKYNLIYKSQRKPGKHNKLKKKEYYVRDLIFSYI